LRPLNWNAEAAAFAQAYANRCTYAHNPNNTPSSRANIVSAELIWLTG
jgi:hypothetical protein